MTTLKRCTICGNELPATPEHFSRDRSRKDGLHPYCKACRNVRRAREYRENPEQQTKARARASRWYRENPERAKEQRKRQYHADREENIQKARQWREENPERYRATLRAYKQRHFRANREQYNSYVRNRRARLRKAKGNHTAADIDRLYEEQTGQCAYCGADLSDGFHVDHVVPISRGGSNDPSNLALACPACNYSKNDRLLDEWYPITGH